MAEAMANKRCVCKTCSYPTIQCICDLVPSLSGSVKVWILQDKKESRHAKNTARLFILGYKPAQIVQVDDPEQWHTFLQSVTTKNTVLLYPDDKAKPLEILATDESSDYSNIVLLDGTWRKAKKMLYTHDVLASFPMVSFTMPPKSHYVIRKSPSENALSTFEAATYALDLLSTEFDSQAMTSFFAAVVERQWAQQPQQHKHLS